MNFNRSSGVILHPTSLPGPFGIGDLGPEAHRWIDFLAAADCGLWQILPLGPTGYGDSPYQSFSAFAGNPFLISPEALLEEDLLHSDDLVDHPHFPTDRVDFGAVIPWKLGLLDRSYIRFENVASPELQAEFDRFQTEQFFWLEDFALFMALKEAHGGAPWPTWEVPLRDRQPQALVDARKLHEVAVRRQIYRQFLFYRQWGLLQERAHSSGITIIGDAPIFVAHDSADVWAHPELFYMDRSGNPSFVAGVPPDYFSPTGQLWGNPLYLWELHQATGYEWWIARLKGVLRLVDVIRLDHFRGFAGYWEIPAGRPNAEAGRWVPGPGADFFDAMQRALGELPLIAEDLGVITEDVVALRKGFGLPGMKVFQFAFNADTDPYFLPHNYPVNCVAYTGTHDNDTTRGWFESSSAKERDWVLRYLGQEDGRNVVWAMMRAIWVSVAAYCLAPMQDLLDLSTEARMNFPGRPSGNWSWRMPAGSLTPQLTARLKEYNSLYERRRPVKEKTEHSP